MNSSCGCGQWSRWINDNPQNYNLRVTWYYEKSVYYVRKHISMVLLLQCTQSDDNQFHSFFGPLGERTFSNIQPTSLRSCPLVILRILMLPIILGSIFSWPFNILSRPPPPTDIRVSSDVRPHSASISHNTKEHPMFRQHVVHPPPAHPYHLRNGVECPLSCLISITIQLYSSLSGSIKVSPLSLQCHANHLWSVTYFVIGCLSTIISPTSVHTLHTLPLRSLLQNRVRRLATPKQ